MSTEYLEKIYRDKKNFHLTQAKLPFEEKIKIVIKLQERSFEMSKANPKRRNPEFRAIWKLDLDQDDQDESTDENRIKHDQDGPG